MALSIGITSANESNYDFSSIGFYDVKSSTHSGLQVLFENVGRLAGHIYSISKNTLCFAVYEKNTLFFACLLKIWIRYRYLYDTPIVFSASPLPVSHIYYSTFHIFSSPAASAVAFGLKGLLSNINNIVYITDPCCSTESHLFGYSLPMYCLPDDNRMTLNTRASVLKIDGKYLSWLFDSFVQYAQLASPIIFKIASDFAVKDMQNILYGRESVEAFLHSHLVRIHSSVVIYSNSIAQSDIRALNVRCARLGIPLLPYDLDPLDIAIIVQED